MKIIVFLFSFLLVSLSSPVVARAEEDDTRNLLKIEEFDLGDFYYQDNELVMINDTDALKRFDLLPYISNDLVLGNTYYLQCTKLEGLNSCYVNFRPFNNSFRPWTGPFEFVYNSNFNSFTFNVAANSNLRLKLWISSSICDFTPYGGVTPTLVPTEVPTPVPTEAPTPVPTEAPTPVPTEVPTPVPTEAPTPVPTEAPTPVPGVDFENQPVLVNPYQYEVLKKLDTLVTSAVIMVFAFVTYIFISIRSRK